MRKAHVGARGGLSPALMFLIAAAVILAAVGIWYFSRARVEEKKRSNIGKVGAVSTFTLEREAGINLPFASQATAGTASPDTTIEIPLEWGKDTKTAAAKIAERYDAIEKKLTRTGEIYAETVAIKIDRDLEYRTLYQAVFGGVDRGFTRFEVACYPSGESRDVRYLSINPPAEFVPGKNVLLFRLFREGETRHYVFGVSKVREYPTLGEATIVMKNTTKTPELVLVFMPALDMSVQNVIEALNSASFAGFQKITLSLMKVE